MLVFLLTTTVIFCWIRFVLYRLLKICQALGCAVTAKSDKGEIIEVLIKHWEDTCTQNTSIRSYPTTSPEKTSVSVQMVSDIPYSPPQVPVQDYTLAVPDANNLASVCQLNFSP